MGFCVRAVVGEFIWVAQSRSHFLLVLVLYTYIICMTVTRIYASSLDYTSSHHRCHEPSARTRQARRGGGLRAHSALVPFLSGLPQIRTVRCAAPRQLCTAPANPALTRSIASATCSLTARALMLSLAPAIALALVLVLGFSDPLEPCGTVASVCVSGSGVAGSISRPISSASAASRHPPASHRLAARGSRVSSAARCCSAGTGERPHR